MWPLPFSACYREDREFVWVEDCQSAFKTLKGALTKASPPDPALPYILYMDARNVGNGAVLVQEEPKGERVVVYYSRTFNKAERRYNC